MDYLSYKGYRGTVEFCEADNCLCGHILGLKDSLILYEGETLADLRADFEAGVDSYVKRQQEENIPFEQCRLREHSVQPTYAVLR